MPDFKRNCMIMGEQFFFFRKLFFFNFDEIQLKSLFQVIALKFSSKQVNLISKKSVSAIWEIMNINVDFRIFVNATHSIFLKKNITQVKLKPKFF